MIQPLYMVLNLKGREKAVTNIEKRTGMTDAECEYWDDYFTNNPYEPGPNLLKLGLKPGFINKSLQLSEPLTTAE